MPQSTASRLRQVARQANILTLRNGLHWLNLASTLESLIHALQRERGTKHWFLKQASNQAADALSLAQTTVDASYETTETAVRNIIERLPATGSGALCLRLAECLETRQTLEALRRETTTGSLSAERCFDAYCELLEPLLRAIPDTISLWVDPSLAVRAMAMLSIMQAREYAGQERALATPGFVQRQFARALLDRLASTIEHQERCLTQAQAFLQPDEQVKLDALLPDHENAVFERLRRMPYTTAGRAHDNTGDGLDRQWFNIASARLDAMLAVQLHIGRSLSQSLIERLEVLGDDTAAHPQASAARNDDRHTGMSLYLPLSQPASSSAPDTIPNKIVDLPPGLGQAVMTLLHRQHLDLSRAQEALTLAQDSARDFKVLERAKTRLMQWYGWTEDRAHRELRRLAMNHGRKATDIAALLLELAERPEDAPDKSLTPR